MLWVPSVNASKSWSLHICFSILSPSLTYILTVAAGCRPVPPYSHYTPNPITSAFSICCRRLSPWKLLRHHGSRDGRIPLWWKYAKVHKRLKMCVSPNFTPCDHSAGELHVKTESQNLPLQACESYTKCLTQVVNWRFGKSQNRLHPVLYEQLQWAHEE